MNCSQIPKKSRHFGAERMPKITTPLPFTPANLWEWCLSPCPPAMSSDILETEQSACCDGECRRSWTLTRRPLRAAAIRPREARCTVRDSLASTTRSLGRHQQTVPLTVRHAKYGRYAG